MVVLDCIKKLEVPANDEYIEKLGDLYKRQNLANEILTQKVKIAEAHSNKYMRKQLKCRMSLPQIQEICDTLLIKIIKTVEVFNSDESISLKMYEEWKVDKSCVPSSVFSWVNFKLKNQNQILAILCYLRSNFDENRFNIIFCRTLLKFINALIIEQISMPASTNQEYLKSKNFKNQLKALCVTIFLQRSSLIEFEITVPSLMAELIKVAKLKDVSFVLSILLGMLHDKVKGFIKKADIHLFNVKSHLAVNNQNSIIPIVYTKSTDNSINAEGNKENEENKTIACSDESKWIDHLNHLFLNYKQISLSEEIKQFSIGSKEIDRFGSNIDEEVKHHAVDCDEEEINSGRVFTIEEILNNFS